MKGGKNPNFNEYRGYDSKLHLKVRLWRMFSTLKLQLLSGPLGSGLVEPVEILRDKED